jgi:hypothetical protein
MIRSNTALKYNPIRPDQEAIIQLRIVDVREFFDSELCVVSIEDAIVNEDGSTTVLTTRVKQFSFSELDALEDLLPVPTGSYMERRIQRFQQGLLFITQNDAHPVYFSTADDWEVV